VGGGPQLQLPVQEQELGVDCLEEQSLQAGYEPED